MQPTFSPAPSRTSIMVAAARALAARDPDAGVRNPDYLAEALIGPAELALIVGHPLSEMLNLSYEQALNSIPIATLTSMMVFRTRFMDRALEQAVADGATQVVVLGAGFDSRAYRFADLLKGCRVVEIDAPTTQDYKKQRVIAALGELPGHVVYVAVDFARESLREVFEACGLRPGEKTFFIWEGVTMYLPEASVRGVLRTIAEFGAAGSRVVLDFVNSHGLAMLAAGAGNLARARMNDSDTADPSVTPSDGGWGEPWIFAVPGDNGTEFFRELGFEPRVMHSTMDIEAIKRYAVRADGRTYAAETMERMRAESDARFKRNPGSAENVALLAQWKAIMAAGGFYWFAELEVVDKG